ncbi:hypothetical protein ACFP51_30700 [Streptomyces pratens]|uniref:Uncharacterized protein n=1 Tax=Streptomyces pratens TaxID=887456 RepID=A0ABW1M247_9ACTN
MVGHGEHGYVDRRVVVWSVAIGFPATVGGALLTPHPGGPLLVRITEGVVAAIGVRLVLFPHEPQEHAEEPRTFPIRMVSVAAAVGAFPGLPLLRK